MFIQSPANPQCEPQTLIFLPIEMFLYILSLCLLYFIYNFNMFETKFKIISWPEIYNDMQIFFTIFLFLYASTCWKEENVIYFIYIFYYLLSYATKDSFKALKPWPGEQKVPHRRIWYSLISLNQDSSQNFWHHCIF